MSTNYPSNIDNDQSLLVAQDVYTPTLVTQAVNPADTVINVMSTAGYANSWGVIVIDMEEIFYQSLTPTSFVGCIRGANNTTPQVHKQNAPVNAPIISSYINNLKNAIIAIETLLGINGGNFAQLGETNVFSGSQRMGSLILDNRPSSGADEWTLAGTIDGFDNSTLTISQAGVGVNPTVNIVGNFQVNGTNVGNSIDPSILTLRDDFITSQNLGDLGWQLLSSNPPATNYLFAAGHPGVLQLGTSNTAPGDYVTVCQQNDGFGELGQINNLIFDSYFIFRIEQTTNIRFRIGFAWPDGVALSVVPPSDGVWLSFDTNAAYNDASFNYSVSNGGIVTSFTAIPVDTGWHKLRIFSSEVGTIQMSLDETTPVSFTGGQLSPQTVTPFVQLSTNTTSAIIYADIDFIGCVIKGLTR